MNKKTEKKVLDEILEVLTKNKVKPEEAMSLFQELSSSLLHHFTQEIAAQKDGKK